MHTILIADDDPVFREVTGLQLEMLGYKVVMATDGNEAIDRAAEQAFDLVVVDIHMPDKDGLELILELKEKYPSLQLLAVTAGSSAGRGDHLATARVFGAHGALRKPIMASDLEDMVGRLIAGRASHSNFV